MSAAVKPKRLKPAVRAKQLNWGERLDILDALALVLDGIYAHLPLKRSLYGFDILRGIEQLKLQLHTMSDLQFHRVLTTMMNRLRDAHTQYYGPWTKKEPIASLPFLVEAYGPPDRLAFVASKVDRRSVRKDPHFEVGVEIEYWNGVPFKQALDLHAEDETGGRPDARQARALESMTFRALDYAPPPNEEWVVVGYKDLDGRSREVRLYWEGFDPRRAQGAARSRATRRNRGINPGAEAVRRAKKYRFDPEKWRKDHGGGRKRRSVLHANYDDFLFSEPKVTRSGTIGYLRIWSFDVDDDSEFLQAAIEHLRKLPQDGLIIDIRDNPGGFIYASERMLQLFTPSPITPVKFALRATRLTAAMGRATFNQSELGPWQESLTTSESTGEPYSSHLPITSVEQCNDLGQHYGGPVVLITNANTYSAGDLFAAGFVDNGLGPVVCIGEATGAGGANVWEATDIRDALAQTNQPLPGLPAGVSFMVAIRRAVRGSTAEGTLIEDAGIVGQPYAMTKDDIFDDNKDLIEHCGKILATQPRTRLDARFRGKQLSIVTEGLDQLEFFIDDNPAGARFELQGDGEQRVNIAAEKSVALAGYSQGVCRQKRRIAVPKPRKARR